MKNPVFSSTLLIQLFGVAFAGSFSVKVCPPGFMMHTDSCYFFSPDIGTFAECTATCMFLDSHLADIHDAIEDAFIQHEILYYPRPTGEGPIPIWNDGRNYFLGGTDMRQEGQWYWENPESPKAKPKPFVYTNWLPHEPDNSGAGENCLMLLAQKGTYWYDQSCSVKLRCICKTKALKAYPYKLPNGQSINKIIQIDDVTSK